MAGAHVAPIHVTHTHSHRHRVGIWNERMSEHTHEHHHTGYRNGQKTAPGVMHREHAHTPEQEREL